MSIAYLSWAFGTEEPRLGTRLVLFVLGEMAQDHTFPESEDDEGPVWPAICWPSVKTIMRQARLGRTQCFEALAALEKLGLMRTVAADQHELTMYGRRVKTPIRQLAGPDGFKRLPCEAELPVRDSGPEP